MHFADLPHLGRPALSFEFFPPKNPTDTLGPAAEIRRLSHLSPDFISVTYGAGGGTRERTHSLIEGLSKQTRIPITAHLTCIGHTRDQIRDTLARHAAAGVSNILALRGDPPQGSNPGPGDFPHASDLVRFIKESSGYPDPRGFGVAVAGFPEGHPGTPNRLKEMDFLKAKVDAGADCIITQLFFDNRDFHDFRARCQLAGIHVPILAGILPVTSLGSLHRMAELAGGARIPARLLRAIQRAGDDPAAVEAVGIHHAAEQCADLLDHGVDGLHFYTLNRADAVLRVCQRIGLAETRSAA